MFALGAVRSLRAVAVLALVGAVAACDKGDKSRVEQRADELAASASAALASASASAAPDPKEEKFKELSKSLHDRATAFLVAEQKLYEGVNAENKAAVRSFFGVGADAEAAGKKTVDDISFVGPQGMTIRHFDIGDVTPAGTLDGGTTDITEEQATRGKPRCVQYTLRWQDQAGTLVRVEEQRRRIVACATP